MSIEDRPCATAREHCLPEVIVVQLSPACPSRTVRIAFLFALGAGLLAPTARAQSSCAPQLLEHLTPSGGFAGFSVATDAAGSVLVVGDASDSSYAGAVFVYHPQGGSWVLNSTLHAPVPADLSFFGRSVALDAAGTTLLVGTAWDSEQSLYAGAAHVFTWDGAVWNHRQKLLPLEFGPSDNFGTSVALNAAGDLAIVGAPYHEGTLGDEGTTFVFRFDGSIWTQEAQLSASVPKASGWFGASVAIDDAGATALVGAPGKLASLVPSGNAYLYELGPGNTWSEVAALTADTPAIGDRFGAGVALNGSGERALVGAPGALLYSGVPGFAETFERNGQGWFHGATLTGPAPVTDAFGTSVGLSHWGDLAFVGGHHPNFGKVRVFSFEGTGWDAVGTLAPVPTALDPRFGWSLAATAAGDRVFVGSGPQSQLDAAWEFATPCDGPTTYCTGKLNSQGCVPQVSFAGSASASAGSGFPILARFVLPAVFGILFYGDGGAAALPFQGGTLCVAPPIKRTSPTTSGDPGGPPCSGLLLHDFNAFVAGGSDPSLVPGAEIHAQFWYRDPPSPSTTGFSNAIQFVIEP